MSKKRVKRNAKAPKSSSGLNRVKQKLAGKSGKVMDILDDVKKVQPGQWKDPSEVEKLARTYIDRLGLSVPEHRIKQFKDAYQDALKARAGADELIEKYGKNVDQDTVKELKKYIPKSK